MLTRLLAVMVVMGCLIAPGRALAFEFGVCVHLALGRSDASTVLRHLDQAGFTSFRDDVYWGAVEQTQGSPQWPAKFEEVRLAVEGLSTRSRSAMLILSFGNQYYDNGGLVTSPAGIEAFSRYADFVVRKFGNAVQRYEVWNEWNTGFGSKPKVDRGDPVAYVRLLAETSKAIKRANPHAMVVGGATSGVDLKWLREFIEAGGLQHLDAISVHSYTLFRYRENPEGAINSLDRLRAMLVAASPTREIPIYVTEMGWPTSKGKHGVAERDAAKYLARFMMLTRARPWIAGVWWYDLFDDGDSDTTAEHRFGLVARDGRLKPAYLMAQKLSPLLLTDSKIESFRSQSGAYIVTGTDSAGAWAMAWAMEKSFLDWVDGRTKETVAPVALEALATQVSEDGFPTLFRQASGSWRADADWLQAYFPRVPAPTGLNVQRQTDY